MPTPPRSLAQRRRRRGTGGGPGRIAANEQPTIGLGTAGQQLPRIDRRQRRQQRNGTQWPAAILPQRPDARRQWQRRPGRLWRRSASDPADRSPIAARPGPCAPAPGAGIPGGRSIAGGNGPGDGPGGNGGGGGNGAIGAARIGRPGAGNDRSARRHRRRRARRPRFSGIGRAGPATAGGLAAEVQADQPQLAAGTPPATAIREPAAAAMAPAAMAADPTAPPAAIWTARVAAGIARQSTGGLPTGARPQISSGDGGRPARHGP